MSELTTIADRLEEQEVLSEGRPEWPDGEVGQRRTIRSVVNFVSSEIEREIEPCRRMILDALHRGGEGEPLEDLVRDLLLELSAEHERALRAEGGAA